MSFDIEEFKPPVRRDVGLLSVVSVGDEVDSEADEAKVDGQGFSAEKSVELGADGAGGGHGETSKVEFEEMIGAESEKGDNATLSEYERRRAEVKELAGKGAQKSEIASRVKVPPFVAGKLMAQARAFTREQILSYVEFCVESEEAVKTGRLSDRLAVELLIAKKYE